MTTHKNHGKTLALAAAVLGSALAMPALAANMVLNNVDAPASVSTTPRRPRRWAATPAPRWASSAWLPTSAR
jgi:hypothetical protein